MDTAQRDAVLKIAQDMLDCVETQRRELSGEARKGMHVPYHGPLCSVRSPSVLRDVTWWARALVQAVGLPDPIQQEPPPEAPPPGTQPPVQPGRLR